MRIIQQQPSTSGYFKNNIIENVISVWAEKGILPGFIKPQDVVFCELPFNKKYAIGHFPNVQKRDECVRYIFENKHHESLVLSFNKFFCEPVLTKELVNFILENFTLQKYLFNLFNSYYKDKQIDEIMDMDAFNSFNVLDITAMKRGKYVKVGSSMTEIWSRTLPISTQLRNYGLTKFEYFQHLINKHEKVNHSANRVIIHPGGMRAEHSTSSTKIL